MNKRDKSIKDWFCDYLPADVAALAMNNTEESLLTINLPSLDIALSAAFVWYNTKQGHEFWSKFASKEMRDAQWECVENDDCFTCDGVGELPGDPRSNHFPTCPDCKGSGDADRS